MDLNIAAPAGDLIKDSNEASFMADVIEASKEIPVIVDFWATWCGPCKTLGPALEKAVTEAGGKVKMVKIDVDQNQGIAQQLRIQSIPTVYGFVDGQPVDGFMGAQPESEIKAFIDRLVAQGPGDGLDEALDAADEMLEAGAVADAVQTYAAILEEDKTNLRAIAGMVHAYLELGEVEQAKAIWAMVPEGSEDDPALAKARAQLELAETTADTGELGELERAVAADENNHQARFDLALALVAKHKHEEAIDQLLELFRRDREWNDDAARQQLFKVFDSLGPKSELAQTGRRKLSSMIFL